MTTSLSRVDHVQMELARAEAAARDAAISEFAQASVEEIILRTAEKRLAILDARRKLVLREFDVTDVAALGDKLSKNKFAAEKLIGIFGGTFELLKDNDGKPIMDVQTFPNDPDVGEVKIFTFFGRYTRPDGVMIEQMGSFSTKDPFFAKAHGEWKSIGEIEITSVMVAAQTEAFKKAVFRGCGLGDWSEADKKELLTETQAAGQGHDFKGSVAGAGKSDIKVGFGNAKDTLVNDLTDKDLAWYEKAYQENLEDPDKKKWNKANKTILDAIKAEKARRAQPAEPQKAAQEAVTPTASAGGVTEARPEPADSGRASTPQAKESSSAPAPATPETDPAAPKNRGKLISDVFRILGDAVPNGKQNQAGQSKLLRRLCEDLGVKETGAISELDDKTLAIIASIPLENLQTVAAAIGG